MTIDKTWIELSDRSLPQYEKGVNDFLEFAFRNLDEGNTVRCPCRKCSNIIFRTQQIIYQHLMLNGINKDYKQWYHHGEDFQQYEDDDYESDTSETGDGMRDMLRDIGQANTYYFDQFNVQNEEDDAPSGNPTCPNKEATKFYRLLQELEQELYPGCEESSTLSFIVELLNWKCLYALSANAIDGVLQIMKRWFPKGNKVPSSYFDCKKISQDLGLSYKKIDACINDCILYRNEYENAYCCPNCGENRWKSDEKMSMSNEHDGRKKIPQKVLRYFPIIPRLQRLYMSSTIAKDMRWHKEKLCNNESMAHPVDSPAWKRFDTMHPSFALEPRNVRLGLASDGFNPFGNMSTSYSVWPVVLLPYNLPPWLCMKEPYFMISLLIPGPKAPGNDIDIYLEPLIDDLKYLWEIGVETYDAFSESNFQLHAAVLWTINDFPAYANLSGWSTKGKLACPTCNLETSSRRLQNGHKTCYLGHRRFLPTNHSWRKNGKAFDGTKENRSAPKQLSGDDIIAQYNQFSQVTFGKIPKKRKRGDVVLLGNWRKKSVFFQLPYWRTLELRHNLDVMHIEKNVCDNIIGTLLNIEGKTKDTVNTRLDLELMGIRPELHATPTGNSKYVFRPACYTLSKDEKRAFCQFLNDLKVPDGYSSNISRCVNITECKIFGLKCHDSHVLLHRYLPLAIRGLLGKEVCEPLIELCTYFRELCAKVLHINDLERLEKSIPFTLCKLEKIFPPSFFDIMVHLTIHLVSEARLGGPVQYRWMYPIERYLRTLKSYVRNKARPEGSIAEAYIVQECMHFCSRYLHGSKTALNRVGRNYEGSNVHSHFGIQVFSQASKPLLGKTYDELSLTEWAEARMYVLENCEEVREFVNMHKEILMRDDPRNVERRHKTEFYSWFKKYVIHLHNEGSESVSDQLLHLAYGPDSRIYRYKSILINGWRFNTKDRDLQLKSQNSGILVKGDADTGNLDYFGVLTDIIQLNYHGGNNVILFKADWWDVYHKSGFKIDKFGFPMVNVTRKLNTDEPYVLASQAEQVYYVRDIKELNWQVVVKTKPRDFFDLPDDDVIEEPCQENENFGDFIHESTLHDGDNVMALHRSDLDVATVEVSSSTINTLSIEEEDEIDSDEDTFLNVDEMDQISEDEECDDDDD